MPLVRGMYPATNALWKVTGNAANATQGNLPVRSNAEWLGLGTVTDSALASTGVMCVVACPVEVGDVITTVSIMTGATGASTPTHQFAALYGFHASAPPLIAQSTDSTTTAIAASTKRTYTLSSAQRITATHAPYGYIYVAILQTGTTISTACSVATATATQYSWFTNSPICLSGTSGSGITTTADATLTLTAKATAPLVFLQ